MSIRELAIERVSEALEASPGAWCGIVVDAVLEVVYERLSDGEDLDSILLDLTPME